MKPYGKKGKPDTDCPCCYMPWDVYPGCSAKRRLHKVERKKARQTVKNEIIQALGE